MERIIGLYRTEMTDRIAGVRAALRALPESDDELTGDVDKLYDAYLHAHTLKGTSMQLGFDDTAATAERMLASLRPAQDTHRLAMADRDVIEQCCDDIEHWLESAPQFAADGNSTPPEVR